MSKKNIQSPYINDEAMPNLENNLTDRYEFKPQTRIIKVYRRPEHRTTSETMTMFEYAEVVSVRSQQLANDDMAFTDVKELTDTRQIAMQEIRDKKCPLSIERKISDGGIDNGGIYELWTVNELGLPRDV